MKLTDRTGRPFEGDYPNVPSTDRLRVAVQRQIDALNSLREHPGERDRLIEGIQNVRNRHRDLFQISRSGGDRGPVLQVAGEILVNKAALAGLADRKAIQDNRLEEREIPGPLADVLVRLVNETVDPVQLGQVVSQLRAQRVAAAPNYVVATAAVGKGGDTPEPVEGPGPFAGYPVPVGAGVSVGIIDTGITSQVRTDGWLAGVRVPPNEEDPLDRLPQDKKLDVAAGHGTHIAGIVEQVAPGVVIRVYQALDTDGCGSDLDVAIKMLQAVNDGCKILSLSCGTTVAGGPPPMAMAEALKLIPDDVLIVAAAGNDGNEDEVYPAAFAEISPRVVSVAGLTEDMKPADWSSRGSWVRASTIAEGVRSTFPKGDESSQVDHTPDRFDDNAWAAWGGTSFAVPQIVGAVARICQQAAGTTPVQAWQMLSQTGVSHPTYGKQIKVLPAVS
jgi:hypothetical protein